MKTGDFLFVYGTLRPGEHADLTTGHRADRLRHHGEDQINGAIYDLGWYPGAKAVPCQFDSGAPFITGDVFEILDASITPGLDAYEGYPNLYNRIETETAKGRHVWVYTYNADIPEERRIASGDWRIRENMDMPSAA